MSLKAAEACIISQNVGGVREPVWLAGCLYDIRLNSDNTNGRMSLTVITSPEDNVIAPPHEHLVADELIYVLDGILIVNVYHGDVDDPNTAELDPSLYRRHELLPGDFIWMPAGTIEALHTEGMPMTAIFLFTPAGGSDEFFRNAGEVATHLGLPGSDYVRPTVDSLRRMSTEAEFQAIPHSVETGEVQR